MVVAKNLPKAHMRAHMPWMASAEEDRRFIVIFRLLYIMLFIVGTAIPLIRLPEVHRDVLEKLPPQLAKIVMESKKLPPPLPKSEPVPEQKPEAVEKEKPKVEEQKAEELAKKEEPKKKEEIKETKKQKIKKTDVNKDEPQGGALQTGKGIAPGKHIGPKTVEQAREKAATSGVLAFSDALADMRESLDMSKLSQSDGLARSVGKAEITERSIITGITGRASATSGGISTTSRVSRNSGGAVLTEKYNRDVGGTLLKGRETTRVASAELDAIRERSDKEGGKAGRGGKGARGDSESTSRAKAKSGPVSRSDESFRKVFDSNRGVLFAIYNRALRDNPSLKGKVTIELVIEPSGMVSFCKILSSELNNPALEAKLVNRIKLINFGAENVLRTRVNYSFDLLPY